MNYGSSNDLNFSPLQEDDGWRPSGLVSGDFYREPDNVCRGVTISAMDLPDDSVGFKGGFVDPDYYRQPEGMCIPGMDGYSMIDSYFVDKPGKPGFEHFLQPSPKDDLSSVRFSEADRPPAAPTDSFFEFELTTIYAGKHTLPHDIGNTILDFLNEKTTSVLTKVRIPKFAITADVFAGGSMCSLKSRVYEQDHQYAIQFQRRSGDTVTYNKVFKEAKSFFSSRLNGTPDTVEAPDANMNLLPPPIPADLLGPNEADITPLHDLCKSSTPSLQAEAVGSLHKLALEGNRKVYAAPTFECIRELLQSSSSEVSLPTSCLVSVMAKEAQAAELFASGNTLAELLDKALDAQMYLEIRLKLSQAFHDAVQNQTKMTLSHHAARELAFKLQNKLQLAPLGTKPELLENLEKAQSYLNQIQGA